MEVWIIKQRPPGRREWSRGRMVGNGSYEAAKPLFDALKETMALGSEILLTKTPLPISIALEDDEDN